MVLSFGKEEKIVCHGSWLYFVVNHHLDPWSHEESNHVHGERASLRYGCLVLVLLHQGLSHLETNVQVVNISEICVENFARHSSFLGQRIYEFPAELVEAFEHVNAPRGYIQPKQSTGFDGELGEVSSFFRSCSWYSSEHIF